MDFSGAALSTTDAGATFDAKTLRLDLYGKWQSFAAEGLEEQDGDNVVRGTFKVGWSALAQKKAVYSIVNEVATLP